MQCDYIFELYVFHSLCLEGFRRNINTGRLTSAITVKKW